VVKLPILVTNTKLFKYFFRYVYGRPPRLGGVKSIYDPTMPRVFVAHFTRPPGVSRRSGRFDYFLTGNQGGGVRGEALRKLISYRIHLLNPNAKESDKGLRRNPNKRINLELVLKA
jgi:hypothetical protein